MAELKITADNFEAEVINSDIPVLVDFWADWCGPCKMLAPTIEALAEEFAGKVKVGKVNVDEESLLAAKFQVMSIPTVILFKGGEAVEASIGFRPKEEFVTMLKGVL